MVPDDLPMLEDPTGLTNASLLYRRDQDGYTVYDVGADQRDDNGDLGALPPYSVGWWIAPEGTPPIRGSAFGCRTRLPL